MKKLLGIFFIIAVVLIFLYIKIINPTFIAPREQKKSCLAIARTIGQYYASKSNYSYEKALYLCKITFLNDTNVSNWAYKRDIVRQNISLKLYRNISFISINNSNITKIDLYLIREKLYPKSVIECKYKIQYNVPFKYYSIVSNLLPRILDMFYNNTTYSLVKRVNCSSGELYVFKSNTLSNYYVFVILANLSSINITILRVSKVLTFSNQSLLEELMYRLFLLDFCHKV